MTGSPERLAQHLGCEPLQLTRWLAGEETTPPEIYLELLDLVSRGPPRPPRRRK